MDFKERLVELAKTNVEAGGRPFSCLIVKGGVVLAEGVNRVSQTHDPTAHAEICAIREATVKLQTEHLIGCTFYILAHPCPMCLAAMYDCSHDRVVFVVTRDDYAYFYQDDRKYITFSTSYNEFAKPWSQRRLRMVHPPIRIASRCISVGRNSTPEQIATCMEKASSSYLLANAFCADESYVFYFD